MPFLAKRIFNHDPVEITTEWGLRDLRQGMAYSICSTLECPECGVVFLDYRFSDQELSRLYQGYRDPEYNAMRMKFEPDYSATAPHYQGRAVYLDAVERILAPYIPDAPRVLDWGGGSGINSPFRFSATLLHVYDISGVDVCAQATSLTYDQCLDHSYDLIVCSQVLEHVPYPIRLLQRIKRLMQPRTILYLEVPLEDLFQQSNLSAGILWSDITFGKISNTRGSRKRHWHEHINFFSPTSLEALVSTCGFRTLAYESKRVSQGGRNYIFQALICRAV
jgi:SAM-dependent methyltransferase